MITNLFDADREKRRPIAYSEIPKPLVHALVSVEDKRFFKHLGLDPIRMAKAAYVDLKQGRKGARRFDNYHAACPELLAGSG